MALNFLTEIAADALLEAISDLATVAVKAAVKSVAAPAASEWVYVLRCRSGKWYVGRTTNPRLRVEQHEAGAGSMWTRKHLPEEVTSVTPMLTPFDEDSKTIELMALHGIENVRGGSYVQLRLPPATVAVIQRQINTAYNRCFRCGAAGHFAAACPERRRAAAAGGGGGGRPPRKKAPAKGATPRWRSGARARAASGSSDGGDSGGSSDGGDSGGSGGSGSEDGSDGEGVDHRGGANTIAASPYADDGTVTTFTLVEDDFILLSVTPQ